MNYSETRSVLIRQAKQLLTDVYQNDIMDFHMYFCIPANKILKKINKTFLKTQVFMIYNNN